MKGGDCGCASTAAVPVATYNGGMGSNGLLMQQYGGKQRRSRSLSMRSRSMRSRRNQRRMKGGALGFSEYFNGISLGGGVLSAELQHPTTSGGTTFYA